MRRLIVLVAFLAIFQSNSVFAEEKDGDKPSARIYLEAFGGYYEVPGFFFSFKVDRHPSKITGYQNGVRLIYSPETYPSLSFGLSFIHVEASGNGEWGSKADLEKHHVKGAVTGNLSWELNGGAFTIEKRFCDGETLSYRLSLDLGCGYLSTRFDGVFNGIYLPTHTRILGVSAKDKSGHLLPIVTPGFGLLYRPTDNLYVFPSVSFGTLGWSVGGGLSLSYSF